MELSGLQSQGTVMLHSAMRKAVQTKIAGADEGQCSIGLFLIEVLSGKKAYGAYDVNGKWLS